MIYLRNRKTTEYKAVEPDSPEFFELVAKRDPDDRRPIWEQTGPHDAAAAQQRIESGNTRPEDIGDADQPVGDFTARGAAPGDTFGPDLTEPTPGEVDQGAGRAADDADETFGQVGSDGAPVARPAADPEGLRSIQSGASSSSGDSESGDYKSQDKDTLEDEIEKRNAERNEDEAIVPEGTGANGRVVKSDLVAALEKDDEERAAAPA